MTTLFISDLHLEANRPEIGQQFVDFLENQARDADALYILGDLFESWVGDDDPNPHYAEMKSAIRELSDSGVPVRSPGAIAPQFKISAENRTPDRVRAATGGNRGSLGEV